MHRIQACVGAALLAVGLGAFSSTAASQQKNCLHDSGDEGQAQRRKLALAFTRHVNTQQSQAFGPGKSYVPLSQLSLTQSVPQGFAVQLSADVTGYSFSVVDRTDPCRFGFFSNQDGLIYRGQALQ